jgi:hypothetical protein
MVLAGINYTDLCDAMNFAFNDVGLVQIFVDVVDKVKDCTAHHVEYMVCNMLYIYMFPSGISRPWNM